MKYLILWMDPYNHEISWKNCADLCTDDAKAMMGRHDARAIAKIKEEAKNCNNIIALKTHYKPREKILLNV